MSVKLCDKGLAESHDLHIGLAVGIEVSAALAAADGKTCQRVLEDLLKAEEFDDADIYVGSETQTAFVWAESAAELYTETTVDLNITVIVYPRYSEHDLSFGLSDSFDDRILLILRIRIKNRLQRSQNLCCCLKEFRLVGIFGCQLFELFAYIGHLSPLLINVKIIKSENRAEMQERPCQPSVFQLQDLF